MLIADAEKGKYFQVQANHIAPQGAKYSRENVKKEKELSRVSFCVSISFPCQNSRSRWTKVGYISGASEKTGSRQTNTTGFRDLRISG